MVCGARLIRNLASVAVVWDQSEWATAMAELLVEMKIAAEGARAAGKRCLGHKALASFLERSDTIVETGLAPNPEPVGRKRDCAEKESYNLARALGSLKEEATLYAKDLAVPFSNNQAESDLRMVKCSPRSLDPSVQSNVPSDWPRSGPTSRLLPSTASERWTS